MDDSMIAMELDRVVVVSGTGRLPRARFFDGHFLVAKIFNLLVAPFCRLLSSLRVSLGWLALGRCFLLSVLLFKPTCYCVECV
jgi:hypothetical protein